MNLNIEELFLEDVLGPKDFPIYDADSSAYSRICLNRVEDIRNHPSKEKICVPVFDPRKVPYVAPYNKMFESVIEYAYRENLFDGVDSFCKKNYAIDSILVNSNHSDSDVVSILNCFSNENLTVSDAKIYGASFVSKNNAILIPAPEFFGRYIRQLQPDDSEKIGLCVFGNGIIKSFQL